MSTNNAIQIRKVRDFGSVISDTFSLFFPNFALFAKVYIRIIAPVLVIGALMTFVFVSFGGDFYLTNITLNSFPTEYATIFGVCYFIIILLLGYCYMQMMVVAFRFIKIKANDPEREVSSTELMTGLGEQTMSLLRNCILYILLFMALFFLIFVPVTLLGGFGVLIIFCMFPVFAYYGVATSLYLVVSFEEDLGFEENLKRSMYLIKDNWWLTLVLIIVIGIIVNLIAAFIQYIPAIFIGIGSSLIPIEGGEFSMLAGIGGIIVFVFYIATMILQMINFVFLSLWYYSLVEDKEGISIMDKINQIGEDDSESQYGW